MASWCARQLGVACILGACLLLGGLETYLRIADEPKQHSQEHHRNAAHVWHAPHQRQQQQQQQQSQHRQGRQLLQNPDVPALGGDGRRGNMEDFVPEGYGMETHKVYTRDGFVLTLHRLPHGMQRRREAGRRPVALLVHGFSLSSVSFAVFKPNESIAYTMADAGFDVWMFNQRTNDFSRGHLKYSYREAEYWYNSIDESALIDMPATIDYVLEVTGASKVLALTHSQGGTLMYAMMAALPAMQSKVAVVMAMGPPVFMDYSRAPFLTRWARARNDLAPYASLGEAVASRRWWTFLKQCDRWVNAEACATFIYNMFYGPSAIVPTDDLALIFNTWPATTSARLITHWAQMMTDEGQRLIRFDYGTNCANLTRYWETCNQVKYGSLSPPEYDLRRVEVPVFILQGSADIMVVEEDVAEQERRLPQCQRINYNAYVHMDFVWDRGARHAFDVVDTLLRYSPGTY